MAAAPSVVASPTSKALAEGSGGGAKWLAGKTVLVTGGALAIDPLLRPRSAPYAIVEAFNPAVMGPPALAAQIFGDENRWGKLPVTMDPHEFIYQKNITEKKSEINIKYSTF